MNKNLSTFFIHYIFGIGLYFYCKLQDEYLWTLALSVLALSIYTLYNTHQNMRYILIIFGLASGFAYAGIYDYFYRVDKKYDDNIVNIKGSLHEYENYYICQDEKTNIKVKFYKYQTSLKGKAYIDARIHITSTQNVYNIANNIKYIGKVIKIFKYRDNTDSFFDKYKRTIHQTIQDNASKLHASILSAMILGDTQNITKSTRTLFSDHGISHILCISGLHISSILLCGFFVFRKIFAAFGIYNMFVHIHNRQFAILASIILIIFYMIIAGGKISSIRAFSMSFLFGLSVFLNIKRNILENLIFIACCILAIWPYYILYPSFQLSFLSVFFILQFSSSYWMTFYLFIGTAPVSIYHFKTLGLLSLVSNFVIIPITSFITMPLIIILLLCPISIIAQALDWILYIMFCILNYIPIYIISLKLPIYFVILFTYIMIHYSYQINTKEPYIMKYF